MKKSKESGKSKKKENSKDLAECLDAVRNNDFTPPKKRVWRFRPTEQEKRIIYSYAAYGATNEDIGILFGVDEKTIARNCKEELQAGRATAKNTIAERIYKIAVGREAVVDPVTHEIVSPPIKPNLSALIFLAKTRLGWRETSVIEQNVDVKSSGVQIYLPDNGMKVEEIIEE